MLESARHSYAIYRGRDPELPEVVVSALLEEQREAFQENFPCAEPGAVIIILDRYASHTIVTTLAGEEDTWVIVEKRVFMNDQDIDVEDASFLKNQKFVD